MNKNETGAPVLRAALMLVVVAASACVTVRPGEGGIFFKPFDAEQPSSVLVEGTHFVAPWEDVIIYDLRWKTAAEQIEVQTQDKVHLKVAASISYRPKKATLAQLNRSLGPAYYESTVRPLLVNEIREHFGTLTLETVGTEGIRLQAVIGPEINDKLHDLGVETSFLSIGDIDYPPELAAVLDKRMAALQEIKGGDAKLALAQKEAEIAAAKAKGVAEASLAAKEGEARIAAKEAEIAQIRSQGSASTSLAGKEIALQIAKKDAELSKLNAQIEAERIQILSKALTPMYLKLKMLQAQETLAESSSSKFYFMPLGNDGVPLMFHPELGGIK